MEKYHRFFVIWLLVIGIVDVYSERHQEFPSINSGNTASFHSKNNEDKQLSDVVGYEKPKASDKENQESLFRDEIDVPKRRSLPKRSLPGRRQRPMTNQEREERFTIGVPIMQRASEETEAMKQDRQLQQVFGELEQNLRRNPDGVVMKEVQKQSRGPSQGNFRPSQPGNFGPSQPGNFRPNQPGNFRPNQPGNFRPSQPGNFGPSQPGNFRPNQPGNFRPNQPGNFRPSQPGNFGPSQPGNFRPNQPGNFRPNQPGNSRGNSQRYLPAINPRTYPVPRTPSRYPGPNRRL